MRLQRLWACLLGTGFIIVGILRFIPIENVTGWQTPEPIHGLLHLSTGAVSFWSAWVTQGRYAEWVNRWFGMFWLLLGIFGNLGLLEAVEALAFSDNGVHLIVGVISVALGWKSAI